MTTDHVVGLRDGWSMTYAQYGDPAGFPIISAHAGLACRLDVEAAASIAGQSGIRLISPDRPGVGRSDPQPGRTILDWVSDLGELLDLLAIGRFAAMGWSLGGTVPGTIWVPADSGVHHLGYWSDDVESDLATLEANGMRYEVKSYNPDGSGTLLWAYCKGPTGPRIELVSRAMEPFIEYRWSTADSGSA